MLNIDQFKTFRYIAASHFLYVVLSLFMKCRQAWHVASSRSPFLTSSLSISLPPLRHQYLTIASSSLTCWRQSKSIIAINNCCPAYLRHFANSWQRCAAAHVRALFLAAQRSIYVTFTRCYSAGITVVTFYWQWYCNFGILDLTPTLSFLLCRSAGWLAGLALPAAFDVCTFLLEFFVIFCSTFSLGQKLIFSAAFHCNDTAVWRS